MTAADVLQLRAVDLPSLASDERVTVEVVPALECDSCGQCPDDGEVQPGQMVIVYGQWSQDNLRTYACSPEHADIELRWLLRQRPDPKDQPRNIRVLVSEQDAPALPVPDSDDDEVFAGLYALKEYIRTLHAPDVETFRNKALAAVSSLGLARIEQLGRAS